MLFPQDDGVVDVATEKINNLLESFMGINDTELGEQLTLLFARLKFWPPKWWIVKSHYLILYVLFI